MPVDILEWRKDASLHSVLTSELSEIPADGEAKEKDTSLSRMKTRVTESSLHDLVRADCTIKAQLTDLTTNLPPRSLEKWFQGHNN